LPLGLFDEADYDELNFKAKAGACFSCSTATVFSCTQPRWSFFWPGTCGGDRRRAAATKSADCVVNEIFKAVTEHAAGVDTFDDQTVVAIKVKAGPGKRK